MITKEEVSSYLKLYKQKHLHDYHLTKLGFFGSIAREEHTQRSDLDILEDIQIATNKIKLRTKEIKSSDDFLENEPSLILLDSVCMQLIAIGQGIKNIDKIAKT